MAVKKNKSFVFEQNWIAVLRGKMMGYIKFRSRLDFVSQLRKEILIGTGKSSIKT